MRLIKIGFLNFRSFGPGAKVADVAKLADEEFQFLLLDQDIVFLIGKNNSGKSNIITGIEKYCDAKGAMDKDDFFRKSADYPIVIDGTIEAHESELTGEDKGKDPVTKWFGSANAGGFRQARVRRVWAQSDSPTEKYSLNPEKKEWIINTSHHSGSRTQP